MPVTLTENIDSRTIGLDELAQPKSAEFLYTLRGLSDEALASAAVASSTPTTYQQNPPDGVTLARLSISLEPLHVDTENPAACIWNVQVSYGVPEDKPALDEPTFSFDTTGGTQHITQSRKTISNTKPGGGAGPANFGAIGVSESNGTVNVEGLDITVPVYSWTETHVLPAETVNKTNIRNCTGKVNNNTFRAFTAGEVLFLGASGTFKEGNWEITFKFAAAANAVNIPIGGNPAAPLITVPAKKGWEYLWVRYQDDVDAGAIVKKPIAAYVEQVYEDGDFSTIGIGA